MPTEALTVPEADRPIDLLDCMACYLAVQAASLGPYRTGRRGPDEPPRWREYRGEAAAVLAGLATDITDFAPRSAELKRAVANASSPAVGELMGRVPRDSW